MCVRKKREAAPMTGGLAITAERQYHGMAGTGGQSKPPLA